MNSSQSHDFRSAASAALRRAKAELASEDPSRVRYAALELRMCIEAITYDKAQAYGTDFPPDHYETWQPSSVMRQLIELDPLADTSAHLRIRLETGADEEDSPWIDLGVQEVFSLRQIRDSYSALGNYLHYPHLKQVRKGGTPSAVIHRKCTTIAEQLEKVLLAPVHNSVFGSHVSFQCECGLQLKKRVPMDGTDGQAICYDCRAEFLLKQQSSKGKYLPIRRVMQAPCSACKHPYPVPVERAVVGFSWTCQKCDAKSEIALASVTSTPSS